MPYDPIPIRKLFTFILHGVFQNGGHALQISKTVHSPTLWQGTLTYFFFFSFPKLKDVLGLLAYVFLMNDAANKGTREFKPSPSFVFFFWVFEERWVLFKSLKYWISKSKITDVQFWFFALTPTWSATRMSLLPRGVAYCSRIYTIFLFKTRNVQKKMWRKYFH